MADGGPTTAGSIIGKLSIDRTEWLRDSAATKADAKELGELDPTIHVKANVEDALAELDSLKAAQAGIGGNVAGPSVGGAATTDAVAAAQKRLTAAESAAANAASTAYIANLRLQEIQDKRGRTELQVAAATEAAARADRNAEQAELRQLAATTALTAAREKAAAAAAAEAAAAEADTSALEGEAKATDNTGKSMSRLQAIFTAVVALGPGLIPIAGWAVGAGGALTAMLGAGVLAILGIKNELKSGGDDAAAFASGLSGLKGNLSSLEATAASGVLSGFQSVVGQIDADMPDLNAETEKYSRLLGAVASTSVEGLLGGWKQLSPLVSDVASYLVAVDQRLASFAMSPQFAQFVNYAEANLPRVENLLNSLVSTAFHVLAAFAPWGGAVVDVLTVVSNIIEGIPTPVLATLIELALGGSLAFKAWTSIPTMLMSVATTLKLTATAEGQATVATGALGAAIDFMEGPIGWVVGGLGALAAIALTTASSQDKAASSASDYASALQLDNGVIGDNVRLQAAKNLQDEGALDNATKLGIKTDTLVKAALGNKAATESVTASLDKQKDSYAGLAEPTHRFANLSKDTMTQAQYQTEQSVNAVSSSLDNNKTSIKAAITAYNDLQGALDGTKISTKEQLQAQTDLANEYGISLSAYLGVIATQKQQAAQAKANTALMQTEVDAAGLLSAAFDKLNGKTLDIAESQTTFDSGLLDLTDSLKKNGSTMAGNTRAGLANQQVVEQQIRNAQANAEAISGGTKLTQAGTAAYITDLKTIRDRIAAYHGNTDAIQAMINKLGQVPKTVATTAEMNTADALKKLLQLQSIIAQIKQSGVLTPSAAKTATANAKTMSLLTTGPGHAAGGMIGGIGSGTSDSNLIPMSVGEMAINANRTRQYSPVLQAINSGSEQQVKSAVDRMGLGGGAQTVSVSVPVQLVNKSGMHIDDIIELHIQQHGFWQQVHLDAGGHS